MTPTVDLFGAPAEKPRRRVASRSPVPTLIGVYVTLFNARFGARPVVTGKDGAAIKRLIAQMGAEDVARRLPAFLDLDDPYLVDRGFPLSLFPGAWNRLVSAEREERARRRVPSVEETDAYLRRLRGDD